MKQLAQKLDKHGLKIALIALILLISLILLDFFSENYLAFAEGDSMAPTFSDCTLLVVNKQDLPEELLQGDIAVVDISDQQAEFDKIAHRVVENLPLQQKFSTRGDNSAYYDFSSSIDGFFDYGKFGGKVDSYYILPSVICK